jgi:hypothetical protein
VKNDKPAVWPLVIETAHTWNYPTAMLDDMRKRDAIGRERYGVALQPFNGRNALQDAYEEALDLVVYLRQAMEEQMGDRAYLIELRFRAALKLAGEIHELRQK